MLSKFIRPLIKVNSNGSELIFNRNLSLTNIFYKQSRSETNSTDSTKSTKETQNSNKQKENQSKSDNQQEKSQQEGPADKQAEQLSSSQK